MIPPSRLLYADTLPPSLSSLAFQARLTFVALVGLLDLLLRE